MQSGRDYVRIGDPDLPKLICVHGFGDDLSAFDALGRSQLTDMFELVLLNLPGFGGAPAPLEPASLDSFAQFILDVADMVSPDRPVVLLAHSVASVIATKAATERPDRIAALISIEGNLTAPDAYFSALAACYDTAPEFLAGLLAKIAELDASTARPSRYAQAVRRADSQVMFDLGRDVASRNIGDSFGESFLQLQDDGVASFYFWGRHNSPPETAAFVDRAATAGKLHHREFFESGHWKFADAPAETAQVIMEFCASLPGSELTAHPYKEV
ncbi:alpha/beta fold hydrolase [Parasphingopyxis sp.]|uniref:alpha/beta fold hydrolase n=1 Tax=Parasphingopyxis sp. TaxID=1920299 RepID=UPI0026058521|nr:alpha/beta fold hydrolase [Parasphingopyxis sp.]